ncbi:MAG: NAD(+)/NADH kinase [Myxococcales bacterium]|nr:NAD(+)/NADH kinase [Myxococcales bacterium]
MTTPGRVAFLLKRDRREAIDLCRTLVDAVRARGLQEAVVRDYIDPPPSLFSVGERELAGLGQLRLLVVLGGDGTMLYGASLLADGVRAPDQPPSSRLQHGASASIPILGVNLGHLGFLTCCAPEEAVVTLHAALDGHLPVEDRRRLRCRVLRSATGSGDVVETLAERSALNDVVFSQPNQARLSELEALVDGDLVTTYRADGLIVATATGSTAYNLAAGGPILMPGMDAVVLTPICPHTLTARPVVTRLGSRIVVRPGRSSGRGDELLLTVDGQWTHRIGSSDFVEVTSDAPPVRIHRPPQRSFFDLLRTKLHWGIRS